MHLTKYGKGGSPPIIFGKMHFLLVQENEFFHEIKQDGIASLMDCMVSDNGGKESG